MVEPDENFTPPFCPNRKCKYHSSSTGWPVKKNGFHFRQFDQRHVQRYACLHCEKTFSSQTFSTTYWLKRPDLLHTIYKGLLSCAAFRQVARVEGVSPSTIDRQACRIGRHMMLFHELHRPKACPEEPLVVDGFESFEFSQYWPTHLNTVVGADSHFVYATTVAELRRKGRRTDRQTHRREQLEGQFGRPDPKSIEKSVAAGLALVVPPGSQRVVLETDEHKAYVRSLKRLPDRSFEHHQTSSKAPRTSRNALFPINLLHLLMRHSGSNHKRETIAWSKRNQSMVWRDSVHRCWRNYGKHISERKKEGSPAMRLGLFDRILTWPDLAATRLFPSRIRLAEPLDRYYWGRIKTRQIPNGREHEARFAY
jgi:transposase-like protein